MAADHPLHEADWVHGHPHEPNPLAPAGDSGFVVITSEGVEVATSLSDLTALPGTEVAGCLIVSTGHGTSGPFTFGGALLVDLLAHLVDKLAGQSAWRHIDIVSADGFGTRLTPADLSGAAPILLAWRRDGQPLTRAQGLVRLIVPSERDDALRQVKWVARIEIT